VTFLDCNFLLTRSHRSRITVTDQVNRKIQQISDGLGRLVTVNEQDATGALTQATTYSYNYLDKLTQVNQGGPLRSYKYDAMGRLLYERIPEQSATINDGTGTMWSCQYTYTEFSEVATRTDARGVVKKIRLRPMGQPYRRVGCDIRREPDSIGRVAAERWRSY
jgi:hypothetical protein